MCVVDALCHHGLTCICIQSALATLVSTVNGASQNQADCEKATVLCLKAQFHDGKNELLDFLKF